MQVQQLQNSIDMIYLRIHEAQDKVLSTKNNDFINLSNASTSYPKDAFMIKQFMAGTEERVCSIVANLLRKHIRASWEKSVSVAEKGYQDTQKDMVRKYANLQDTIEIGEAIDDQCESRVKLTEWMQRASHVVPIGLVQFSDFMSDVIAIIQLYKLGGPEWVIAVSAMSLSTILA